MMARYLFALVLDLNSNDKKERHLIGVTVGETTYFYMEIEQKRALDFMVAAKQELPNKPVIPSVEIRKLRARLLLEEVCEHVNGLGLSVFDEKGNQIILDNLTFVADQEPDLIEIVDGISDIKVIVNGTANSCGVDLEPIDVEVYKTNMAKFGPGGYMREDGKWIKPLLWQAPNIKAILEEQRNK